MGKIADTSIPILRLSPRADATLPTIIGPAPHPRSPNRARIANIKVPPRTVFAAILKVPGQSIPTENPHIPQPIRDNQGRGQRDISK